MAGRDLRTNRGFAATQGPSRVGKFEADRHGSGADMQASTGPIGVTTAGSRAGRRCATAVLRFARLVAPRAYWEMDRAPASTRRV